MRRLYPAAYVVAVVVIAAGATGLASLLPVTDPVTAWGVCVVAGNFAALTVLIYLPWPCHRKDSR